MVNPPIRTVVKPAGHDLHVSTPVRSTFRCVFVAVTVGRGCLVRSFSPGRCTLRIRSPTSSTHPPSGPRPRSGSACGRSAGCEQGVLGAIVMEVVAVMAYYLADVVVRGSDASILVSATALAWVVLGIGAGRSLAPLALPSTTRRA